MNSLIFKRGGRDCFIDLHCKCVLFIDNVFENASEEDSVRASGKIEVSFTPRAFPTAMRESTKHLEDEV